MATSFFNGVKNATPKSKSCIKLVQSPLWFYYKKIDDDFVDSPDFRMEAVKAFFRTYQNCNDKLDYTIEEVEALISIANDHNLSTDKFFDFILMEAKENAHYARFVISTFAYLRNELKSA